MYTLVENNNFTRVCIGVITNKYLLFMIIINLFKPGVVFLRCNVLTAKLQEDNIYNDALNRTVTFK